MPSADFVCVECKRIETIFWGGDVPAPFQSRLCEVCDEVQSFRRAWSAPSVGRVDGAGDSPARSVKN